MQTHQPKLFAGLLLGLMVTSNAHAATFLVTIKNTSSVYLTQGVLTLSPLLSVGPTPTPGTNEYATYIYAKYDCSMVDQYCPAGSMYNCWLGNSQTLIERWGLTQGVNAWIPQPPSLYYGYHVFAPGDSVTTVVTASPGQKLSYITKAGNDATYYDEIVMMHAPGNPADLTVPLFDANGLPLSNITFDLGGYDVSSSSPTDGTSAECANQCATSNGGCYVALGSDATGALLPPQPTAGKLSLAWEVNGGSGYTTDGLALGNLTVSSGNELVVSMEGGASPAGVGRAMVLASGNGALLSKLDDPVAAHDFMGFPMVENLLQGTYSNFIVNEFAAVTPTPGSVVYARSGSASPLWTSTGYGYAGLWNMGASAGDVRTDGTNTGNEVVIADYNGDIVVLKRDTAATLNTYNLFSAKADNIYGHAAIGDVNAATGNEIVVFGAKTGKVYVLGTQTTGGTPPPLKLLWTSAAQPNGGYAFGSGPAIADLDGDNSNEIVVATGGNAGVYAYNTAFGTGCKYKWSTPGGFDYSWSAPVVGDVDGDGKPEVIVMSSDSVLSVLKVPTAGSGCTEGTVLWKYTVGNGGSAWFTPALANLTGTSALDVVVANYQTLEVLDVTQRGPVWRYNDPTAQFFPSAVIEHGTTTGFGAAIYVSGWVNGNVYKLTTPTGSPVPTADWSGFMGGNTRTGAR